MLQISYLEKVFSYRAHVFTSSRLLKNAGDVFVNSYAMNECTAFVAVSFRNSHGSRVEVVI